MKTESLFVRNIFLNLLTITFVAEADDILGLLLIGSKARQRADELVNKAINEDLASRKIRAIEVYYWPRVLALLPVVFSIISIYRQNKDLSRTFSSQNSPCLDVVYFTLMFIGSFVRYLATLLDFIFSQYAKIEKGLDLKESFIAATEHITCMGYAFSLSYIAIVSGLLFYVDSAKTYYQINLTYNVGGWEGLAIASIIIIDCLLKRISFTNTKNRVFYFAIFLSLILWGFYIIFPPLLFQYIFYEVTGNK